MQGISKSYFEENKQFNTKEKSLNLFAPNDAIGDITYQFKQKIFPLIYGKMSIFLENLKQPHVWFQYEGDMRWKEG